MKTEDKNSYIQNGQTGEKGLLGGKTWIILFFAVPLSQSLENDYFKQYYQAFRKGREPY